MRKLLIIGLAVMAIGSFNACINGTMSDDVALSEKSEHGSSDQTHTHQRNEVAQWEANQKYETLINSFGTVVNRFGNEIPKYPDFYGGSYFSEHGKFIIYIHGDFEEGKRAVISLIGNDDIEFKKAEYSYQYLCDISDEIVDYLLQNKTSDVAQTISSFGVMDNTNTVEVRLIDLDDAKAEMFSKTVSNRKGITFKTAKGRIELKTDSKSRSSK